MPKVKWGGEITSEEIDNAEPSFVPYAGPQLPPGVYRFRAVRLKKTVSSNDNPMLKLTLLLDPRDKSDKKYKDCPVFDQITVIGSTAWKVRNLCEALGVTSKEFLNQTVCDEDDYVMKIGKLRIPEEGVLVTAQIKHDWYKPRDSDEKRLAYRVATYLPKADADGDDTASGDPDDADGDEADPF